jgi:Domain of unknown function (DUF4351)
MGAKTMTIEQAVLENLRQLQPEQQQEVLNFVQFLRQKSDRKQPRRSLYGLWSDLNIEITVADIAEARQEMWGNFPREFPYPNLLLSVPGLLPLAALSQTNSPRTLLEQIATRIATIEEPTQQADVLACTQVLAGLRFEKNLIRQLFRKETMRESVIYQEIREDGLEEGLKEGRKNEALSLITRLLTRRIGTIAPEIREQIQTLSVEELEDLGEALLDFSSTSDLTNWLSDRQP